MELDCYTYKVLLRDAYISSLKETEYGRGYLKECYHMKQGIDRKALRDKFGK